MVVFGVFLDVGVIVVVSVLILGKDFIWRIHSGIEGDSSTEDFL